ncbi:hypothetical protein DRO33_02625 [Candidatus Bathyarchaeota archaeon]|nr:MAG: hypothetical protein DRO33_02625 [Candidatus Bathyarchaeota archaeon]
MRNRRPFALIETHVGGAVRVFLKNGWSVSGALAGVDPYMNILLEEAVLQERENKSEYPYVLVRGSSVLYVVLEAAENGGKGG